MKRIPGKKVKVLFVCSTNTSLSPLMAAIFLRDIVDAGYEELFELASAGAHSGKSPRQLDRKTRQAAARAGIVLPESASRNVSPADVAAHDLVVVMNEASFWHIKSVAPDVSSNKLRMLMEFSGQLALREMPDPLLGDTSYEQACAELFKVSKLLLQDCLATFQLKRPR